MPWGAAIAAGGTIIGGALGASGANKQIGLSREALEYQKWKDAQIRGDLEPYRRFGGEQLNALRGWLNDPSKQPSSYMDPGYEFRRTEGMKGVTGNAATAGLLQSGDTLRGIQQYGQGLASSEYGNAFNRWLQEGGFRQGLAGMGQNAAIGGGQLAIQGAENVGNITSRTNFGGPDYVWGDVAAGLGGGIGNAFARRQQQQFQAPRTPGGSNIFVDPNSYGNPNLYRPLNAYG